MVGRGWYAHSTAHPWIPEISLLVEEEAVSKDLDEHLHGEDAQIDPLAHVDEGCLARAARVEGRFPRHRRAVENDREKDDRVKRLRLDQLDGPTSEPLRWA